MLTANGQHYLFDAGRGVTTRLLQAGVKPENLAAIFITHHHFDHIGSLGDLILSIWNNGRESPLPIYGPQGTEAIITAMVTQVYAADIAFRKREAAITGDTLYDLNDMLQITEIDFGASIDDNVCNITPYRVSHGHGLGMSHDEWPCLGYRIQVDDKIIAISGDTVDCEGLHTLAQDADLLILCCYLSAVEQNTFERNVVSKHILVASDQAGKIAARANVKTLALTHIRAKSDELLQQMNADVQKDFIGDVIIGFDLCKIEV